MPKFGAVFAQVGKPKLIYDSRGKAKEKEPNHYTADFGKYKTQIWLFGGFKGNSVEEIIANGRNSLLAIAQKLSQKHNITLTLLRFYEDIEWVDIDKERSKVTAKGAKIRKGEWIVTAGALHKYDKHSQDGHLEFNKLTNGDETRPTTHAQIRERLYSGEYERRFEILMESNERFAKNLELHLEVLKEIKEAIKRLGK